jgi:hypothetical protein
MRGSPLPSLLVVAALVACPGALAAEPAPAEDSTGSPIPEYLSDPSACALVVGGGGMISDLESANEFLFKSNSDVTTALYDGLGMSGFRVEKFIERPSRSGDRVARIVAELQRRRCGRIVQVTHVVEGPESDRQLGFDVTVLVLDTEKSRQATGGRLYTVKGLFQKRYIYPLKDLQNLTAVDVANQIGPDLADTGLLPLKGDAI